MGFCGWIDSDDAGGGSATAAAGIALNPAATNDPSKGIFTTWVDAYSAAQAAAAAGQLVTISVLGNVTVPAGLYNMHRIYLCSILSEGLPGYKMTCADGVIFQDLISLSHGLLLEGNNTSDVMFAHVVPVGAAMPQLLLYRGAGLDNQGTVEMFLADSGVDGYTTKQIAMDAGGYIQGSYEVCGVSGPDVLQIVSLDFCTLNSDMVRGAGALPLVYSAAGGQFLSRIHTNHTGVMFEIPLSGAANMSYLPTTLADWSGVSPTSIADALDRIAAHLGPIA